MNGYSNTLRSCTEAKRIEVVKMQRRAAFLYVQSRLTTVRDSTNKKISLEVCPLTSRVIVRESILASHMLSTTKSIV